MCVHALTSGGVEPTQCWSMAQGVAARGVRVGTAALTGHMLAWLSIRDCRLATPHPSDPKRLPLLSESIMPGCGRALRDMVVFIRLSLPLSDMARSEEPNELPVWVRLGTAAAAMAPHQYGAVAAVLPSVSAAGVTGKVSGDASGWLQLISRCGELGVCLLGVSAPSSSSSIGKEKGKSAADAVEPMRLRVLNPMLRLEPAEVMSAARLPRRVILAFLVLSPPCAQR